jgi:hypothetical protein
MPKKIFRFESQALAFFDIEAENEQEAWDKAKVIVEEWLTRGERGERVAEGMSEKDGIPIEFYFSDDLDAQRIVNEEESYK